MAAPHADTPPSAGSGQFIGDADDKGHPHDVAYDSEWTPHVTPRVPDDASHLKSASARRNAFADSLSLRLRADSQVRGRKQPGCADPPSSSPPPQKPSGRRSAGLLKYVVLVVALGLLTHFTPGLRRFDLLELAERLGLRAISQDHVEEALQAWGDSVIAISQVVLEHGDYEAKAAEVVDELYGFDLYPVLFKPTEASEHPFRDTREGAISYLVGGNPDFPEDDGFAMKQWTTARMTADRMSLQEDTATVMGTYFFSDRAGRETGADFTFTYKRDRRGRLRIVVHHSSLPFSPGALFASAQIDKEEVKAALQQWCSAVVQIGATELQGGNFQRKAADLLNKLYGFSTFPVLFNPTRAISRQNREGALSYFVGGSSKFPEDQGFARKPWTEISVETHGISLNKDTATAVGVFWLTDLKGNKNKAEFTFEYKKDAAGHLLIIVQHSDLPDLPKKATDPITAEEVNNALRAWGQGVVAIGEAMQHRGNYRKKALEFISQQYAYDIYPVLFKPSKVSAQPFRHTSEGALSYYVGGDPKFPEDKGFALQRWTVVDMEVRGMSFNGDTATAMGNCWFTDPKGLQVKTEFTMGYRRDPSGALRIVLHHFSLPFVPEPESEIPEYLRGPALAERDVKDALAAWGTSIVEIGQVFLEKGDYHEKAAQMVDGLYAYGTYPVLFKPMKTQAFRPTREGALAYFVGGNPKFPEDTGFALAPWVRVEIEPSGISINEESATAMGSYVFTDLAGEKTRAEFTFGFRASPQDGALKIVLHHSSLPFRRSLPKITEAQVRQALEEWTDSVAEIGSVMRLKGNFRELAEKRIRELYGYDHFPVLFRPTLGDEHGKRETLESAVSYFVGGSRRFPEDRGFALRPWAKVRFTVSNMRIHQDSATVIGSFLFRDLAGTETRANFFFEYKQDSTGALRILVHESNFPFETLLQAPSGVQPITEKEVSSFLNDWGSSIVEIGAVFSAQGDYKKKASAMVSRLYAYDISPVVFKIKSRRQQFRPTFEGALSFFVGGDKAFRKDKGFALRPWAKVVAEPTVITLNGDTATAMGKYSFTDLKGKELEADFTFLFKRDGDGRLRAILHHSSL